MAFEKGNPGRGYETAQQKRIIRDLLSPHLKDAVAEVLVQLKADENKDRQWAVKTIIEYTCGKPEQGVDISDSDGTIAAAILQFVKKDA